MANKLTLEERRLIRRYLVWCYKATKEELDRIDRKFTQLTVDYFILKKLSGKKRISQDLDDFKRYIVKKEKDAVGLKFQTKSSPSLQPHYLHLQNRLSAIEKAVIFFIGKKELAGIKTLYEKEMTKRIIEAREHA